MHIHYIIGLIVMAISASFYIYGYLCYMKAKARLDKDYKWDGKIRCQDEKGNIRIVTTEEIEKEHLDRIKGEME
jgi:hypothetical protein